MPVQVKPVAVCIVKLAKFAVVVTIVILPEPKLMLRVLELFELNIPVVNVNPAKSNVPEVNVVVAVTTVDNAPANVVVPEWLIVNAAIDLPFGVIVPVPTIVAVKLVNTPPVDNVKLLRFNVVPASVNAVVPKSNLLNQLPVVNVNTAVPEPVNVRFGEVVDVPPVVPTVKVRVISAATVNPPVPVQEKLVAFAIDSTVVAAVVWANIMLLVPNAIERTPVPVEANIPVVKSNPLKVNVPAVKV